MNIKNIVLIGLLSFLLGISGCAINADSRTKDSESREQSSSIKDEVSTKQAVSTDRTASNTQKSKTGTYTMRDGNYSNQISIRQENADSLYIEVLGNYEYESEAGPMANSGTASGYAMLEINRAFFTPADAEECRITLSFFNGGLEAKQNGDCGFGLNVEVSGKYKKISNKPDFMDDEPAVEDSTDADVEDQPVEKIAPASRQTTVKFARGKTSKTVTDKIKGDETIDYILGGNYAQTFYVELKSNNDSIYFVVFDTNGRKIGKENGQRDYFTELEDDGNYRVRVFMPRAQARRGEIGNYSLKFTIE